MLRVCDGSRYLWEQARFPRETEYDAPTPESELDFSASQTTSASVLNAQASFFEKKKRGGGPDEHPQHVVLDQVKLVWATTTAYQKKKINSE